jgi:hypothetical protein
MTSFQDLRFTSGKDPQSLHVAAMEGHGDPGHVNQGVQVPPIY